MLTRKTQYAWMALGGLICLFGLVLACKLRDGNRAIAQADKSPQPPLLKKDDAKLSSPPPTALTKPTIMPHSLPFQKEKPSEAQSIGKTRSEPKATLEMPLPSEPPPLKASFPEPSAPPPPSPSRSLSPASFGTNTPTPSEKKSPELLPGPRAADKSKPASKNDKDSSSKPKEASKSFPWGTGFRLGQAPKPPAGSTPASPPQPQPVKREKNSERRQPPPAWNAPVSVQPAAARETKTQPGEPPLAPAPGPVQLYHVRGTETLQDIARHTLGSSERWSDVYKLNPTLKPEEPLHTGDTVRLPADACVQADDTEPVKPLPALRPKPSAPKAKALPLTGTYQCSLDEKGHLTLPRAIRDQLNGSDTVLLSPGPDKCLWLTNQPHLERLGERLDQSRVNEADVRVFKRLYFAQTEKLPVNGDGRVAIPERLGQFAGLHQEVVLVGIDDHFEVWDAAHWRLYTQQKSAARTTITAVGN